MRKVMLSRALLAYFLKERNQKPRSFITRDMASGYVFIPEPDTIEKKVDRLLGMPDRGGPLLGKPRHAGAPASAPPASEDNPTVAHSGLRESAFDGEAVAAMQSEQQRMAVRMEEMAHAMQKLAQAVASAMVAGAPDVGAPAPSGAPSHRAGGKSTDRRPEARSSRAAAPTCGSATRRWRTARPRE